ncbi:pirin family protein [Aliidiomarina sp. Khilg15.8]
MSNQLKSAEQPCTTEAEGLPLVAMVIQPRIAELGGFAVRRVLPTRQKRMVGPWIFFDEMGPAQFAPGAGVNVAPHPHIGLATVTYLFDGEILHRDSLGSKQLIRPGDINLMVAGRGVVHSERERAEVTAVEHSVHGLQLWLALPQEEETSDPAFYHVAAADIPDAVAEGVKLRVLMGSAYGVTSPVPTFSETLYIEAWLESGQSLQLPLTEERAVYVVSGEVELGGKPLAAQTLAVLSDNTEVRARAIKRTKIVVIGGKSLGPRYIDWNFVASDKACIEQAREDWKAQRFDKVPGDEEAFIPLPR